mgnify:CR=1 FL=1
MQITVPHKNDKNRRCFNAFTRRQISAYVAILAKKIITTYQIECCPKGTGASEALEKLLFEFLALKRQFNETPKTSGFDTCLKEWEDVLKYLPKLREIDQQGASLLEKVKYILNTKRG